MIKLLKSLIKSNCYRIQFWNVGSLKNEAKRLITLATTTTTSTYWDLYPGIVNRYGNTPLHYACEEERLEVAKLLIHAGASVEVSYYFYKKYLVYVKKNCRWKSCHVVSKIFLGSKRQRAMKIEVERSSLYLIFFMVNKHIERHCTNPAILSAQENLLLFFFLFFSLFCKIIPERSYFVTVKCAQWPLLSFAAHWSGTHFSKNIIIFLSIKTEDLTNYVYFSTFYFR